MVRHGKYLDFKADEKHRAGGREDAATLLLAALWTLDNRGQVCRQGYKLRNMRR